MLFMLTHRGRTAIVDAETLIDARRKMFTYTEEHHWLDASGWDMDSEGIILIEDKGVSLRDAWYDRKYC